MYTSARVSCFFWRSFGTSLGVATEVSHGRTTVPMLAPNINVKKIDLKHSFIAPHAPSLKLKALS
jgi:hypothetical protein